MCCSGRSLVAGKRLARTRAAFGVLLVGKKSSRGRAGPMALRPTLQMRPAKPPPLRPCGDAVAGIVDVRIVLAVVIATVALTDAEQLRRVDFALLLTFAALFVFVGNMVRIPLVHDAVAGLVGQNAVIAAVGASQVISNVPAAVLLSGFTSQWDALIVGTNLGGLGTLIASMASLITFKAISIGRAGAKIRYLKVFTLVNVVFLVALLGLALLFGL